VVLGTVVPYTVLVVLGTFSALHGPRPYFFECPIVRKGVQRLSVRHGGFLVLNMVIESVAFSVKTHVPASWLAAGRDGSPFSIVLFVSCVVTAMIEAWTNRSLLERAHQQGFSGSNHYRD
jgi:hypothetical protein